MKKNFCAIIGTGFGLRVIYNTLKYINNCEIKFIYSRKKNKKSIFTRSLSALKKYKPLKFVFVETPPFTHIKYLDFFKDKKIFISCEKPIVNKISDLKKFKRDLNNYKFNLSINHQLRYHPHIKLFKNQLKKIGKIRYFKITYNSNNIFEKKKNSWWLDNKKGGGHLFAIAPHLLDLLNFFYGNLKTLEKKLKFINKFNKRIDVAFNLNGLLSNGVKYQIKSTCFSKKKNILFDLKVSGSKGIIKFENFKIIKIIGKKNTKSIKLPDLFKNDSFFINPWRISQFYYLKNFFQSNKRKVNLKKNILQSVKNLDLILE